MTIQNNLTTIVSTALIWVTIVLMSGCSYVMIEAPEKEINMWSGYASKWDYQSKSVIDTDPISRDRVVPFISERFNITANKLSRAHRMHITFERNQSHINENHQKAIAVFSDYVRTTDYSSIVVVGFTDALGSKRQNREVGEKRAKNTFQSVFYETDFSAPQRFRAYSPHLFKKSGEKGRRAEVWLIP